MVSSSDNCPGQAVAQISGMASGSLFPIGTTSNTFEVTDASGNTESCSFDVTVKDTEKPSIGCSASITVSNDLGSCGAIVNYLVSSSDNCPSQVVAQISGMASGSLFPIGTTSNTFEVTDASGNTESCSFDVTVKDTEKPSIICSEPFSVSNDLGSCGAIVNYMVSSSDNCPGQTIAQTNGLASGSLFPIGTTTNTFEVMDASGNTAECSFTISIDQDPNSVVVYTILAEEEIHLHNSVYVQGNIGVWKAGKKAKIHEESFVNGFVKAPEIDLHNTSNISGVQYLAQAPMPDINTFRYNTMTSNLNVNVPDNYVGVYQISGSNFKKIEIGKNTTVKFMNSGDLFIEDFKVKGDKDKNNYITFSGNTNLMIKKKFDLGERVNFNQSDNFTVNVYVEDDVKVYENSNVTANIDARFKEMHVKGKTDATTTMNGQFIAKKVHSEHNVNWYGACQDPNNIPATSGPETSLSMAEEFTVGVNPNPSMGEFTLKVRSNDRNDVRGAIYNMLGKKVTELKGIIVNEPYKVDLNIPNGMYMINIEINGKQQSVQFIRIN